MLKAEVLLHFRNAKHAAAALRVSTVAIYRWGKVVPMLSAVRAERVTGGALRVRQDLYDDRGRPLRGEALRQQLATITRHFVTNRAAGGAGGLR